MPWELPDIGAARGDAHQYHSLTAEVIRTALAQIRIAHEKFVFVDLGSGKGRPLLVASSFPFQKLVGVELSHTLLEVAGRNIQRYGLARGRCQLVHGDAASFRFPSAPLVVFMYNPFEHRTLSRVLSNMKLSLQQTPREIYIVYLNPVFDKVVVSSTFLRRIVQTDIYSIYRSA